MNDDVLNLVLQAIKRSPFADVSAIAKTVNATTSEVKFPTSSSIKGRLSYGLIVAAACY